MAKQTRGFRRTNTATATAEEVKPETKVETKPEAPANLPATTEPAETPEPTVAVQGDQLALAAKLAAKESPFMATTQAVIAKGREDWQGGPIMTLFSLQQTYEDEELNEFPIPGSEAPNNNPDKFKMEYMEGDTKKTKNTSFYVQFAHLTKSGRDYVFRLECLDRVADKGAIKDGIPEDILNMSPEQRRVHRGFCEGRLKTAAQSYRNAMRLHFKIKEVEEYGDGQTVTVDPLWVEGHGPDKVDPEHVMLEPGTECLAVNYQTADMKHPNWEHYSISAFLKLQPKKAEEKGGGWVNLRDSGATKKAPKAPGTAEKVGDDLTIKTPDRFVGFVVEEHRWLDEILSEKDRATYGALCQQLTAKNNDETIIAFVELKNWLNDMARELKLDARYTKIKSAGSDMISDSKVAA